MALFFFGTRNRNHPQRAKVPLYKCVVSLSETVRLVFEPDSTSLKLVEQVDSGEYKRKKEPSEGGPIKQYIVFGRRHE